MYNLLKEDYVRCVWPGVSLPLGKTGKYLIDFFKENYDVNIQYLEETKTLSGYGQKGSRIDQIFNVYLDSIDNFDNIKQKIGAQYAKDIVRTGDHRLYKERIYLSYFKRLESELLKAGVITEKDVYKSIM
ncbi:hypothetical protein [Lentibacillus salicampi]|uniref:Uncharacterized protein n=1 Tax=Lentibacillus salicampi TaxID=175306 RepID=A0A4Y9AFY6_9BACI|nr:hypothetical protein [Lentibacillus salicampi]TFJ94345.1 hypothetical protein E4U82_00025 [Lentibacillus salicampi]